MVTGKLSFPSSICSGQEACQLRENSSPSPRREFLTDAAAHWSRELDRPSASSPGALQLYGAGHSSVQVRGTASGSPMC